MNLVEHSSLLFTLALCAVLLFRSLSASVGRSSSGELAQRNIWSQRSHAWHWYARGAALIITAAVFLASWASFMSQFVLSAH